MGPVLPIEFLLRRWTALDQVAVGLAVIPLLTMNRTIVVKGTGFREFPSKFSTEASAVLSL